MSVENTVALIEAKNAIPVFTGDPIDDRLEIPELREAYRTPPGAFMDFMNEIKDNFERREDGIFIALRGQLVSRRLFVVPTLWGRQRASVLLVLLSAPRQVVGRALRRILSESLLQSLA